MDDSTANIRLSAKFSKDTNPMWMMNGRRKGKSVIATMKTMIEVSTMNDTYA